MPQSNFSLQKTISTIEQRLTSAQLDNATDEMFADDDVMPSVANEMGTGKCTIDRQNLLINWELV